MAMATAKKRNSQRILKLSRCAWSLLMIWVGFVLSELIFMPWKLADPKDAKSSDMVIEISKLKASTTDKFQAPIAEKKHWCIIASKFLPRNTRTHFRHFPHAAEIILPCWSYFVEQEATDNCGFYIKKFLTLEICPWIQEVLDTMGCDIIYDEVGDGMDENGFVEELKSDIQYIPNLYLLRPRLEYIRYLNRPEHAHALRRLFISDEYIATKKGGGKPLQIGMIQRPKARRIDNIDEIKNGLQKAIPSAQINCTNFEFNTVKEQAEWFATKDVVIAAHGAALTNSVFITEGTIVMQMYPPGYFWQSLDPLIEQSGGHAIQWFKKGKNPAIVAGTLNKTLFIEAGNSAFSPPVDEVVLPIVYSLGIQRPTGVKIKRLFGEFQ